MKFRRFLFGLGLFALGVGASSAYAGDRGTEVFDLAQHRGHVFVVNFWATWCAPCRAEMPALDAYYQRHHGEGLDMLAISMDDPSKARQAREVSASYRFPVALARAVQIPSRYRPSQLPMTLVFDRDGVLRYDSRKAAGLMTEALLDRMAGPLLASRTGR